MRRFIYIFILIVAADICGCKDYAEDCAEELSGSSTSCVEVLENGQLLVTGQLSELEMTTASVSTRGEETIYSGWCLIFCEDDDSVNSGAYTDDSPLLQKIKFSANANGVFSVTLTPYSGTAFVRFVVNMTTREEAALEAATAWADSDEVIYEVIDGVNWLTRPTNTQVNDNGIATFGVYELQSVGLDGIYDVAEGWYKTYSTGATESYTDWYGNTIESLVYANINETSPDPNEDVASTFPMSSVGFVMSEITEDSVEEWFGTTVYMVRVCSKVDITLSDSGFDLQEVYMVKCAQEARIRSTVLSSTSTSGSATEESFSVPINLGDTIDYLPLKVSGLKEGDTTDPIYIYPNSGGGYSSNGGAVNQNVNPQYVIIKGRAAGYDTDGYYKIALKAQYPLVYDYDSDGNLLVVDDKYVVLEYSSVTYDILRNTHFNINLLGVDKPGYKTLADAKDDDNPASNISYNITIMSTDGRNEILISNGTYYVELNTTRVYMAGYGYPELDDSAGKEGDITFTVTPNTSSDGYFHPAVYVQADYGVDVTGVTATNSDVTKIDFSDTSEEGIAALKALFDQTSSSYDEDIASTYSDYTEFKADLADGDDEIHDVWYKIKSSNQSNKITVGFKADESGRIRLRIGDMLKFIPVRYVADKISYVEGDLEIGETGVSFAYDADKIEYLNGSTNTNNWFSSYGKVAANSGAEREMQAMIYPTNSDGIAKLYFIQTASTDTDAKADGNTINTGDSDTDSYDEILAAAKAALDAGYTTIYFEGDYSNEDFVSSNTSIFTALSAYVNSSDYKGSSTTYSVDLSSITKAEDTNTLKEVYPVLFQNNTNLYSVTLPAEGLAKFNESSFSGCTNLVYVIVGSSTDVSEDFDKIGNSVFYGCTSLQMVKIYTTEGVDVETSFNTSGWTTYNNKPVSGSNNVYTLGTELNVD